ncbi:MAG: peptide-methionine (S)-S-oxide reductase MsrA [Deltaproteobacteria bacterium]|nr:peptide-methionine (S)-S-oxide reductase MsrA [Deltaproteobacteria bacterium]
MTKKTETLTVGGGCFWCIEATFQSFRGVEKVESGYAGGTTKNPTYDEVGMGTTQHAEVVQITFDPAVISVQQLLTVFFHAHDPTTKNRQGGDVGPQYRSIILYADEGQRLAAETVMKEITAQKIWKDPLVTEVVPLSDFYRAEDYHQDYYANNPSKGYCALVIAPKLQKIRKEFHALLK